MSEPTLEKWERKFRRDAKADKLAIFQSHLRALDLESETTPELMLEGTILVVGALSAYSGVDGQPAGAFLAAQTYNPALSGTTTYAFTFDLCRKASARLLVAADLIIPDLADLFDHPWYQYRVCGYSSFLITRLDGQPITDDEDARLEQLVTSDLMHDYCEGEIDISFDNSWREGSLFVTVRDCEPDDEK